MVSKTRVLLAMTAVAVGSMLTATPAQADILYNWFGPRFAVYRPIFPGRTVVAYAPVVAASPVATGCNTCATTTVGFAPFTTFRPVSVSVPVTTFRPEIACTACGGTTTVMRPITMVTQQVQYQAVTAFQPVVSSGCSTCGVAMGGCASGNCAVNFGAVSSGCSTCGVASVAPTSSFEPTPVFSPSSAAPASNHNVPMTTPEGSQAPTFSVPRTTPEPGTATPTPAIAPQNPVPQTQVEPAEVAPETTGAGNGPSLFRGSASQQLSPQMRAVPHTNDENTSLPQARPQLVDPQDKTARRIGPDFEVKQAIYSTPVAITPVSAAPAIENPLSISTSLNVLTQRARSQEEIDAEGWAPAKR